MASTSFLSLGLCFLVLSHGCFAQMDLQQGWQAQDQQPRRPNLRARTECRIEKLTAQEPNRQFESEAGVTEFWDRTDDLECAGVEVERKTIQSKGLLLPHYNNVPKLVYIVQGEGIQGTVVPGCAETFESELQSGSGDQSQRFVDRHQKVRRFREGDVFALPAGVAFWAYNDGDVPIICVSLLDTSNDANQLDQNFRRFFLAGNSQQEEQQSQGGQQQQEGNVFNGFDEEILAEIFNIESQTVSKLQGRDDQRGSIVRAESFQVISPEEEDEQQQEQQEQQEEGQEGQGGRKRPNGLEETICTARLVENIGRPSRADLYNPRGGRVTTLNSHKLPILNVLRLSAQRGVLYKNAIRTPLWNVNAHSVLYFIRGSGRVQVVGDTGKSVFNGEVQKGQLLVVPQNFAVVKKAGSEGLEWVSFKTNDNAVTSHLAGRLSALRSIPEDVLMNSYDISREDARNLKYNREEAGVFSPRSGQNRNYA